MSKTKRIFIFNLNSVVIEPGQKISDEVLLWLKKLRRKHFLHLCLVSGYTYDEIYECLGENIKIFSYISACHSHLIYKYQRVKENFMLDYIAPIVPYDMDTIIRICKETDPNFNESQIKNRSATINIRIPDQLMRRQIKSNLTCLTDYKVLSCGRESLDLTQFNRHDILKYVGPEGETYFIGNETEVNELNHELANRADFYKNRSSPKQLVSFLKQYCRIW